MSEALVYCDQCRYFRHHQWDCAHPLHVAEQSTFSGNYVHSPKLTVLYGKCADLNFNGTCKQFKKV